MEPEPIATYRLQLRAGFGFDQVAEVVKYLADLGISHVYTSPYLQAAKGSTHGYDVVDPSRVNEEIGDAASHARMCQAILDAGLYHMIDLVPNHMAIAGGQNPWWWDVMENGPSSLFATFFDVDWEAFEERSQNKVLLPVLADHYGRILEEGGLKLGREEEVFFLQYKDQYFPVDPSSLSDLLKRAAAKSASETLDFIADGYAELPRPRVTDQETRDKRHNHIKALVALLRKLEVEEPEAKRAIDTEIAALNSDPDALDNLIDRQNYRLAFWRTANADLGYRRFFDIKDLVGLRVEDLEVFQAIHALPFEWAKRDWVQGFRIDHPDGLRNPSRYFHRLKEACPKIWTVAEKILGRNEKLPENWPIEGTTGYDFLNLVGGLFIDPAGKERLMLIYEDFTGEKEDYPVLARNCKKQVLKEILDSEMNRLASLFVKICERHRKHRDYTRKELKEALLETAASFPVYRSYVQATERHVSQEDKLHISAAIEYALKERPDLDPELFQFLKRILLLEVPGEWEGELAMRFQQLTPSVMAKGVEDTAFYRFFRLVSLNEVGGDPDHFGTDLDAFHSICKTKVMECPFSLLATTTHDTKRSEDVRSRLALLSEMPDRWRSEVLKWSLHHEKYRKKDFPDRNTEYLFYQTLFGAWPIDKLRMTEYMLKAAREAKTYTSWTSQNELFESALIEFVEKTLEDKLFLKEFEAFVTPFIPLGRVNSLSQTLLKLTAPGIPDIYQGTELWDLSLVDPDNRRQVDFSLRAKLLSEMNKLSPEEILMKEDIGLPKLWVLRQALLLRRSCPELFTQGSYSPLYAKGNKMQHAIAFVRGGSAITLAPRLVLGLGSNWEGAAITLPPGLWQNVFTGDEVPGEEVALQDIFARFPVALLKRKDLGK